MNYLTRPALRSDNDRSLKNISSTPANSLQGRIFYAPHSVSRALARLTRSLGVSGIRKDPDALMCVESTPTPFRVVLNLKTSGGYMPNLATANKAVSSKKSVAVAAHAAFHYPEVLSAEELCAIYRASELIKRVLVERDIELSNPWAVREYLRLGMALEQREIFVCLWLDAQNRLIEAETMFVGTLNQTSVYPREVVKAALYHNAAAVIFAHNHPSGTTEPSAADIELTYTLKDALSVVGVSVLDHFITGRANRPSSMAESYGYSSSINRIDDAKPAARKAVPRKVQAKERQHA